MDNIVLTALFVLHGEQDWKAFQNKPTVVHSPYSFYQPRNQIYIAPSPHVSVLTLTLSTASFLDGLLAVGGQLMYAMKTTANRTVVSKYTWEETPRLEEFASIEWLGNGMFGKLKSVITYAGQRRCLEDFLFSSFLGNRCVTTRALYSSHSDICLHCHPASILDYGGSVCPTFSRGCNGSNAHHHGNAFLIRENSPLLSSSDASSPREPDLTSHKRDSSISTLSF